MKSVLTNVTKADVITDPFPHVVIRDVYDDAFCRQLIAEYPSLDTVAGGKNLSSNKRFNYTAKMVRKDPNLSPLWREFVMTHVSPEFLQQFVNIFEEHIRATYPNFERDFAPLHSLKSGIDGIDKYPDVDVLMNSMIAVNTPVVDKPTSVKSGHLDNYDKLYAGLFYLRHPDDDSTGGDLEIYRFKDNQPQGFVGKFVDDQYLEVVNTVKYERNVLVLFLNSVYAMHGVTPRQATQYPRCFLNLVGEVSKPLFDTTPYEIAAPGSPKSSRQNGGFLSSLRNLVSGKAAAESEY
jgi:hypothetical protein